MQSTEEFEILLKEIVNGKRLSASKMNALSDLALKNMDHDTQMVSILYRTHKSLSSPASKISSLYIFDALSRAAKSHTTKHNVSGDIFTQPGNTATFLLKVAGVVEGLFQDMIASGSQEAKEKTKKIYDIWLKGSTFPSNTLTQLAEILKGPEQAFASKSSTPPLTIQPTTDPRMQLMASAQTVLPIKANPVQTAPAVDPQAALLALLTQAAANATQPSMPGVSLKAGTDSPQLGAAQLAVLQHLAHTAAPVASIPQSLTAPDLVNVQKFPSSSGVNGSSRPTEAHNVFRSEQRYNGYRSPEHESRTNPHFDDHDNPRGRYRGGFRGRGRGGRNWDERDRRYRDSERDDQSPSHGLRGGRSRSRSPLRNGERKTTRFGSPPRRAREKSPPAAVPQAGVNERRKIESGKDEFGRDVRTESPPGTPLSAKKSPLAVHSSTLVPDTQNQGLPYPSSSANPSTAHALPNSPITSSVSHINTSSIFSSSDTSPITEPVPTKLGLESFSLAAFDYTMPSSWEALGKMWQVTKGTHPTQEQLLEFVMQCTVNGGQPPTGVVTPLNTQVAQTQVHGSVPFRGRGRGRGGFSRGRGGSNYGGEHHRSEWGYSDGNQDTDAIVLGGGGDEQAQDMFNSDPNPTPAFIEEAQITSSVGSSGRMQKVGDKWVFVRGTAMDVS